MFTKLLITFSLILTAWAYPIAVGNSHGIVPQQIMPEGYGMFYPPYHMAGNGLAHMYGPSYHMGGNGLAHMYGPHIFNLNGDMEFMDMELLKKGKIKPKSKPKPKAKPKAKPKHKPKGKPKGHSKVKGGLNGDVTWKHGGLTVHGHKSGHKWGISINHH